MKVLHVIIQLAMTGGGPPASLASLARVQVRHGYKVEVLACRRMPGPAFMQPGKDGDLLVHEPVTTSKLLFPDRSTRDAIYDLAKGQDIIHIHGTWRYHARAAASAGRDLGIPYIVKPAGNLMHAARANRRLVKQAYFSMIESGLFRRAAGVHCCSQKELREMADLRIRARQFIVPEPVATELHQVKPDPALIYSLCPNLRESDRVILFLGRICAVKRLPVLMDAFIRVHRNYPDTHLIIAGPPEDEAICSWLLKRAQEAGVAKRVSFPGMVLNENKVAVLARADIFGQPSLHENFGISIAEALLFGLPCVVSDGVALADEIAANGAGIVVRSSDELVAASIEELLADPQRRQDCANAALEVAKLFYPDTVFEQMDMEYKRCITEYAATRA